MRLPVSVRVSAAALVAPMRALLSRPRCPPAAAPAPIPAPTRSILIRRVAPRVAAVLAVSAAVVSRCLPLTPLSSLPLAARLSVLPLPLPTRVALPLPLSKVKATASPRCACAAGASQPSGMRPEGVTLAACGLVGACCSSAKTSNCALARALACSKAGTCGGRGLLRELGALLLLLLLGPTGLRTSSRRLLQRLRPKLLLLGEGLGLGWGDARSVVRRALPVHTQRPATERKDKCR